MNAATGIALTIGLLLANAFLLVQSLRSFLRAAASLNPAPNKGAGPHA